MEIKRDAFGTETMISLSNEELERAAKEYLWNTARREVLRQIEDMEEYEDVPASLIDTITADFREKMDGDLYDEQILSTIHKYEKELEEFKPKFKVYSKEVTLTITHEYTIKAKSEEEADQIFEAWSERHARDMVEDMVEQHDLEYEGDWDYGSTYEEEGRNPDYADISEDDIR